MTKKRITYFAAALKREKEIKRQNWELQMALIRKSNPALRDLHPDIAA